MSHRYFKNEECEYYPCHQGVPDGGFSCLFCYCPLYSYGENCGGIFQYKNDVKDCSNCTLPHERENYDYIIERLAALSGQTKHRHER